MSNKRILTGAGCVFALLVIACGEAPASAPAAHGKLRVVATTGMIGDLAARVGGERVEVTALMGPGVDPHLYKASESDVRRLAEADLILYNGLHLEGKMADVLVKMARTRPVVAVSETIPQDLLREPPEFAGQYDPHVWFDVSLWARAVEPIAAELAALDPPHAADYRRRADATRDELLALDRWAAERVASLPEARRVLVTAHDAFGYFGQRYGLRVVGLQGISTLAEAGVQDVERVVDAVVAARVPAIFVESSVPRRAIEAVVAACADRGFAVRIGGELYSDALGPKSGPAGTYDGMVRHNVETIVGALAAAAP
jgi:manganese/zinc/iron transport system substrate-binding protein